MGTYEIRDAPGNNERESSLQKLEEIEGIGRKTAEAMFQSGIHSYADLTRFLGQHTTAKEISEALRKQGVKLSPGFIDREKWILSLHGKQEQSPPILSEKETEETPPNPKIRGLDPEFTIFFDVEDEDGKQVLHTTVYDPKGSGEEKEFVGNESTPWVNWMLERANLPLIVESTAPTPPRADEADDTQTAQEGEVADSPIQVKPLNARLEIDGFQISVIEPTSDHPEKRLKAEINFHLSGSDAEALTAQNIPFRTELYTIDLDRAVPRLASEESQLEPYQFEYADQLEFAIPAVGRYEYHCLVRLLPLGDLMADHKGPTIKVIP